MKRLPLRPPYPLPEKISSELRETHGWPWRRLGGPDPWTPRPDTPLLVTAIGRKSLLILTGGYNFGIGVILPSFHWSGTMPWRAELLIIEVTGGAIGM